MSSDHRNAGTGVEVVLGRGELGCSGWLSINIGVPASGLHAQRRPWHSSVLSGARRLHVGSLLIRGLYAWCGWGGGLGDTCESAEAVGVDWGNQGQRLDAKCVGSILIEQGDGGLLGGEETGGQVYSLHLCAPG